MAHMSHEEHRVTLTSLASNWEHSSRLQTKIIFMILTAWN